MITTPGRLLFEDAVPEEFRSELGPDADLTAETVKNVLQKIAEKAPERYRDISHAILKLGARASAETESSFGLKDLESPFDKKTMLAGIEALEDKIFARKDLTPEQKDNELIKLYGKHSNEFPNMVFDAAYKGGSNLAKMVASGARGSKGQLNSSIGADWLVLDANSNPIPVPIKSNYAEGLSPAEYFASAYGTRRGLISTKFATQDSGYLGKQLSAAAHDMVVTESDCGTDRGIPTDPDDKDNVGAILARPVAGHPAGSVITSRVLSDMKQKGVKNFIVRSPLTCGAHSGLCSSCSGIRERNHLPKMMDNLGLASSSSLAEPLSQGSLSEKHTAGVANATGKTVSGFKRVDSLVQVPETFPGGAAIAQLDGSVTKVEPAPQGGTFVYVNGKQHYVGPQVDLKVKQGDVLEAGDVLSGGVPNPAEIVQHKGIGEGRLYFVSALRNAFRDNGLPVNRRNVEVIGRALINHVKIDDPEGFGNHLPDDVVEYNSLERDFEPSSPTARLAPAKSVGKYLYRPTLHYSIGTRITPRVAKTLSDAGESEIDVGDSGPGFVPEMQRVMDVPGYKQDWMAQFAGSNLKKRILKNVHSGGATSNLHGVSYVPGLAAGVEFGRPPKGTAGY